MSANSTIGTTASGNQGYLGLIHAALALRCRHSQVQIVVCHPLISHISCSTHIRLHIMFHAFYSLDAALNAFNLFTISSCAFFLLLAYFRNNDFWSPSHRILLEPPPSNPCASIITLIGYSSTHFGVMLLEGKTCWTQDTAVSRSCAPPSQFRDCGTRPNQQNRAVSSNGM